MIPIFDNILGIIKKVIPDENAARQIALQLEQEYTKQMSMQHQIIMAENNNGSGKWRPRLMYLCMFFVSMHFLMYDLVPYCMYLFKYEHVITVMPAPNNAEFWAFLKIGVGGYIGSRGVENVVSKYQAWRNK